MMGFNKEQICKIKTGSLLEVESKIKQNYSNILEIVQGMIHPNPESRSSISETRSKLSKLQLSKPNEVKYIQKLKEKNLKLINKSGKTNFQKIRDTISILQSYNEHQEALKYINMLLQSKGLDEMTELQLLLEKITCLKMIGTPYSALGDLQKAEQMVLKIFGENSFQYYYVLVDFADAFKDSDGINLKKSILSIKKCLNILCLMKMTNNGLIIEIYHDLAYSYHKLHDLKKALHYVEKSLFLYKNSFETKNIFISNENYVNELILQCEILQDLGQFQKAILILENAISLILSSEGKHSVLYCNAIITLGCVYSRSNNLKKAKQYHQEALELTFELFGENNVLTANSFYFLAKDDLTSGNPNFKEILNYAQKSLHIYEKLLGENSQRVYQAMLLRSIVRKNMKDYDNSLKELENLKERVLKNFGEKSQLFLNVVSNIGQIYIKTCKTELALESMQKSFEISCILFGPESIKTANVLFELSSVYVMMVKFDQAIKCLQDAEKIFLNCFGELNERTIICREKIRDLKLFKMLTLMSFDKT